MSDIDTAARGIFDALPDNLFGDEDEETPAGTEDDQDSPAGDDEGEGDDFDAEAANALDEPEVEADDESDESEDDEDEEDDEANKELTYTVKVDGTEEEISLDELRAGYSRTASWTKKSQALATERKTFGEQQETVRRMEAEYGARLEHLATQMKANLNEEPSPEDPQAWIRHQQEIQKLRDVEVEQMALQGKMAVDAKATHDQFVAEQNKRLVDLIPEWSDNDVALSDKKSLAKFAIGTLGFDMEDIEEIVDHRVVMLLRLAKKYTELDEAKKTVKKKTRKANKVLKPGQTSRSTSSAQKGKGKKARTRRDTLKKSGRVQDAAAFIHDTLLDDE